MSENPGHLTSEPEEVVAASADKRELFGWGMYDWAWSAFSTTITTALLGPYLLDLAEQTNGVKVGGFTIEPASFFPFAISLSALVQVFVLPLIGAIADHTPHKKRLMMSLAYFGSFLLMGLFLVTTSSVLLGGVLFVFAGVAFATASVLYNSFLPQIAPPGLRDKVSSMGVAYGYLGGGIWLAINFLMIALMENTGLAVRLSLAGTGVWALVFFALFPARMIKSRPAMRPKPANKSWLAIGVGSTFATLKEMRSRYPQAFRYLIAYLLFTDGTGTVITVSTLFARDELDAEPEMLLLLVLMIQFVAIPGALFFGLLAGRLGAKMALVVNLTLWTALVIYAFIALDTIPELWGMGVVLAIVLGGAQALSRSLFAQMIPARQEAEYFGFFEIAARGTSWLGPATFGIVNQITGSQRLAVLSLIAFFALGLIGLIPVKVRQGMIDAGQDPSEILG